MCVFVLFGLIGLIERNNQLGLNSGGMRNKGGVMVVNPIKRNRDSKGWEKRKIHFSFGELKRREKERKRKREKREKEELELEEKRFNQEVRGRIFIIMGLYDWVNG